VPYHISPIYNLPSILEKGLLLEHCSDGLMVAPEETSYIYLFSNYDDAVKMIQNIGKDLEWGILHVNIDAIPDKRKIYRNHPLCLDQEILIDMDIPNDVIQIKDDEI